MDRKIIGERLKYARDELRGMSLQDVAEASGVARSTVQRYETAKIQNIKLPVVESFARVLNVNPAWLIGKSDDMEIPSTNFIDTSLFPNIFPLPKTKKIPLLGTIACGEPILATENIESYVDMDADVHADFALRCQGDSMINARIMDGDIVFIRKQDMVDNGEIAAVLMDDCSESQATLKRVYVSDDKIRLCAENPNYQDMIFFENDMNKVRIIGKAIAFLSAVK
jgi:hypothetical protein|nr:MAG TPA: Repressor protein CI [Caudoviricetes sp.]